jgi:NhaA family Na+:H+ antiporter
MREIRAEGSHLNRQVLLPAERFIYSETISDALLLVCAIAALVWANSPWSQSYFALRDTPVSLQIGAFSLALDLQHWINDGLMAIFFFVVALEMKRELLRGDRSDARKAALPVAAALGGMILPAGIFFAVNSGGAGAYRWRRTSRSPWPFSRCSANTRLHPCGFSCSRSRSPMTWAPFW